MTDMGESPELERRLAAAYPPPGPHETDAVLSEVRRQVAPARARGGMTRAIKAAAIVVLALASFAAGVRAGRAWAQPGVGPSPGAGGDMALRDPVLLAAPPGRAGGL